MPYEPPPELAGLSLARIAELVDARKLPPLDKWSPEASGDSEMRIAADGRWYHQGGEIHRPAMIRAFASLLLRDGEGQHWLVTPTQKLSIAVDDAPLMAIDVRQDGESLAFRLNTDDLVIAGPDHPLRAGGTADVPAIYLAVRHGIEARLNRSTWAQLAEIAIAGDGASVSSGGVVFSLTPG
jgi:hypothetical protein